MKKIFYLLLIAIAAGSCKTTVKESTESVDATKVVTFAEDIVRIGIDLRKPGDVADLLGLAGTEFMPELVNDPMNHVHYKEHKLQAAANIGAYLAGGLYQIAMDKKYEGYLSIAAAKQLAIELGIGDILSEIVLDRYAEGEHPGDSILNTVRKGLVRSEDMLAQKEQEEIFAAILVGNYIEKLYLLFANIFDYPVELPQEAKMLILRDIILVTGEELQLMPEAIKIVEGLTAAEGGYLLNELKQIQAIRDKYKLTDEEIEKLKPEMIFENKAFQAMYESIKNSRGYMVATE